ncbi:MAG: cation:proton antiporter [Planctomycetota bacterium]|nr:cation:proton antiporter [Planctomycetota bacterium]
MEHAVLAGVVQDLLLVLMAGLLAGILSRKVGVSLLVGYLVIGAVIGDGGLQWVTEENHELEYFARGGALLLLFSIGLEFSLDEFVKLSRLLVIGGATQMALVSIIVILALLPFLDWRPALLMATAISLSSTVLVFKTLAEAGAQDTRHGRRAIAILLFQDIALVPLILLIPLLTDSEQGFNVRGLSHLIVNSLGFVLAIPVLRVVLTRWLLPQLAALRSRELVVLFTLSLLGGACYAAGILGLPPAIGAFAAGLLLSGNRLSSQIDALLLPFRESFAAVFFVSLGSLLHPAVILHEPVLILTGLALVLVVKISGGTIALRVTGLDWKTAFGMGVGLAQLGEFSFVLFSEALNHGLIQSVDYNRLLFIGMVTLLLTPQLIGSGLKLATGSSDAASPTGHAGTATTAESGTQTTRSALVIGAGPVGTAVSRELNRTIGDVCLVDLSPVNLHAFAQEQFRTVAGDATDPDVLLRARAQTADVAVISVPRDDVAIEVTRSFRSINATALLIVRCRFVASEPAILHAGATLVISEESRASQGILELIRAEEWRYSAGVRS